MSAHAKRPCEGCGRAFRPRQSSHRFHSGRCRRTRDRALQAARIRKRRRTDPAFRAREKAKFNAWRSSERGRKIVNRWTRRWRRAHPDAVREARRRSAAQQVARRKTPRGRVCASCGARDDERAWSTIAAHCAACERRGRLNGYDRDGRAKYKPTNVGGIKGKRALLLLWELATRAWPEESFLARGVVALTSEQVQQLEPLPVATLVHPHWFKSLAKLSTRFGLGVRVRALVDGQLRRVGGRVGGSWRLVLDVERVRAGASRVLDRLARERGDDEREDAA